MKTNRLLIAVMVGLLFQQCARTPSVTLQHNATQPAVVVAKPTTNTATKKSLNQQVVFFTGSFEDLLKEAKRTHKAIFLDFMATWCGPCRQMEQETFSNSGVATYANERYLAYKVDIDWFAGMDIAEKYGVKQYPTIVFLDAQGKYMGRIKGFQPPALFTQYLKQYSPKLPSNALSSL
ncbi:MAG: thioredoxin family protein [Spirosomataceae bacterium]